MQLNKNKILLALTASILMGRSLASHAQEMKIERISKEELKTASSQQFIKSTDFSDLLVSKVKLLFVTVTSRQAGSNVALRDVAASSPEMSKKAWMKKMSTLAYDPDSKPKSGDTDKLRTTFSQQARKATEVKFKEAIPLVEVIKKGINFNLDIKNPSATFAKKEKPSTPVIRYGLVETEILPSKDFIPIASIGHISDTDPLYATPAQVVYTIDRLDAPSNQQLFPEKVEAQPAAAPVQNTGIWSKTPSTDVKVKIDAADQEAVVSDQVGKGTIPGARLTLTQVDGLISAQASSGGKSIRDSLTTEVKLPVYKEMSVSRKFNSKFQPVQTTATNLLADSSRPQLNLSFSHADNKAKGEWIVKRKGYEYNVVAEPRQGWSPNHNQTIGKQGDKVTIGFNRSF